MNPRLLLRNHSLLNMCDPKISGSRICVVNNFLNIRSFKPFFFGDFQVLVHRLLCKSVYRVVQRLYRLCTTSVQTLNDFCTDFVQLLYKLCTTSVQTLYNFCASLCIKFSTYLRTTSVQPVYNFYNYFCAELKHVHRFAYKLVHKRVHTLTRVHNLYKFIWYVVSISVQTCVKLAKQNCAQRLVHKLVYRWGVLQFFTDLLFG